MRARNKLGDLAYSWLMHSLLNFDHVLSVVALITMSNLCMLQPKERNSADSRIGLVEGSRVIP